MSTDFKTVKIKESDKGNLFGLKDNGEKEATRELLGDWLIKTSSFKNAVTEIINKQEYRKPSETEHFLKNLLYLNSGDIKMLL
ncbi:hypothetical protein CV093_01590 [Oceanobacillus sp. 143]|nr:hypothetical protein CV093_01590 [Oceanobacillus sp. 143]